MKLSEELLALWVGGRCAAFHHDEYCSDFSFGARGGVTVQCTWRAVSANGDKLNGDALEGREILCAELDATTHILTIDFKGARLEIVADDQPYEAWHARFGDGISEMIRGPDGAVMVITPRA